MATKKDAAPEEYAVVSDGENIWFYETDLYTYEKAVKRAKVIADENFEDVFIVHVVGRISAPDTAGRNYKVIE